MLAMAEQIIESKTMAFDASEFEDRYEKAPASPGPIEDFRWSTRRFEGPGTWQTSSTLWTP